MREASKRATGEEYFQEETTFDRIKGLLGDPIGVLKNAQTPIIGWLCCHTALEIILAAGLNPFRVIPESTSDMANSFLHSHFYPCIRGSLGKALRGDVDFLAGFVGVNSCDGYGGSRMPGGFTQRLPVSTVSICRAYRPRMPSGVSGSLGSV